MGNNIVKCYSFYKSHSCFVYNQMLYLDVQVTNATRILTFRFIYVKPDFDYNVAKNINLLNEAELSQFINKSQQGNWDNNYANVEILNHPFKLQSISCN